MNLHELTAEDLKAASDHAGNGVNRDPFGQEPLLPVSYILADHISDAAFVNGIQVLQPASCRLVSFIGIDDCNLVI